MGFELTYQALPENCLLLLRSRHDPDFGSLLPFFKLFAEQDEEDRENQTRTDFVQEVRQVVQLHPGIEQRNFSLDRRWDMLYYLLSEQRRNCEATDETSLIHQAIFGGDILHPDVRAGQGILIRYLPLAKVRRVVALLATLTSETLEVNFDPSAMRQAAVYKIRGDEEKFYFELLEQDLKALKTFYQLAVIHHEGVLTCLD